MINRSNHIDRKYPPELLWAPPEKRLSYFSDKDLIINHPLYDVKLQAADDAMDPGLDQNLVILVGPSGVGKTALTKALVRMFNERVLRQNPEDRISIPAIWVEANAPEETDFEWRFLYQDMLEALHAPLIDSTLPVIDRNSGELGNRLTIAPEESRTVPSSGTLRHRLKTMIEARSTQLAVIDEAKSLFYVRPSLSGEVRRALLEQKAEVVRSLVNRTPTTILLAGAFNLLAAVNLTGALARRSNIIYFPPYEATADGLAGYSIGLLGLLSHLPAKWSLDVKKMLPLIFEQSLGQIGMTRHILHKWMAKSQQGGVPMDESLLLSCFFPKAALHTLRSELQDGKRQIDQLSAFEAIKLPS